MAKDKTLVLINKMKEVSNKFLDSQGKPISDILELKNFQHIFSKKRLTFGQKAADTLTKFAGSWTFILIFFVILIFWMSANAYFLIIFQLGVFDPYPFILLNLVLSCLAAIQAPVILMSQNRVNERDRTRAEYDYAVNRKAEKEIRDLKDQLEEIKKLIKRK